MEHLRCQCGKTLSERDPCPLPIGVHCPRLMRGGSAAPTKKILAEASRKRQTDLFEGDC